MQWAFVKYRGQELWHQRWVAGRVALSASEFAIATPDDDVYVEQYGGQDDDIEAVRWSAQWNQPPRGVPANLVYRFRNEPTPDERAAYRQQASVEAAAVCRERVLATGQPQLLVNLQPFAPVAGGACGARCRLSTAAGWCSPGSSAGRSGR